jgi:hypothetical protein
MEDTLFQIGDRVRACVTTGFVQAGAEGTVCAWYPVMPDAYDVEFDGQSQGWLMWDDELEHVLTDAAPAALDRAVLLS